MYLHFEGLVAHGESSKAMGFCACEDEEKEHVGPSRGSKRWG